MKFKDERYPDEIVTEETLRKEYEDRIASGDKELAGRTFLQYVYSCMESQGGTLKLIR